MLNRADVASVAELNKGIWAFVHRLERPLSPVGVNQDQPRSSEKSQPINHFNDGPLAPTTGNETIGQVNLSPIRAAVPLLPMSLTRESKT